MTTRVTVRLSEEKLAAIQALFAYNDWSWDPDDESDQEYPVTEHRPIIPPSDGHFECPDCFCRPCVMSDQNRQLWWPERCREGSQKNKHHRKALYKKFWTMLCHRGLWQDERYLARKSVAVRIDSRHRRFVWQSHAYKREIMPDCVVRQVREWFPNLPSQPYMGHLWQ